VSTVFVGVVVSLFLFAGDIAFVAQITNFSTLASFAMVNLSLALVVRRGLKSGRQDPLPRRVIGLLQPLLALAACVLLAAGTGLTAIGVGLLIALGGFVVGMRLEARMRRTVSPQ